MAHLQSAVVSIAVLAASCVTAQAAGNTSPGREAAYVAANFNLPAAYSALVSASLQSGKSKRVLAVEATVIIDASPAARLIFQAVADNGTSSIVMQPGGPVRAVDCELPGRNGGCSAHGVFWLDLDANPTFIGTPLTVTLMGGGDSFVGVGAAATATMEVRLQKK